MTIEQLQQTSDLLRHALKLQIGCGAEPTLYPHLEDIVHLGKEVGVPYISLTTNGQLIATGRVDLMRLIELGLNEITLSMHGTREATYEDLMQYAKFERLRKTLAILHDAKQKFPEFQIRINFTINSRNIQDLKNDGFWPIWDEAQVWPDVIQLRPIRNLGASVWQDFDLSFLHSCYDETIGSIVAKCEQKGITCIAPTQSELTMIESKQEQIDQSVIEHITYCHISSDGCYQADFDRLHDTFASYHHRKHTVRKLLRGAFCPNRLKKDFEIEGPSSHLNYSVKG
jgi:wyosine [tRNA(Phe)-imidazoG37] synthetase (radical SAM superfamily)